MTVPAPDLAERYGAPSAGRRPLVIAGIVVLAVVGLSWLLWVVLFHGRPQVTSAMVGFDIDGQHAAVARYTVVRRDATVPASCLLRAYADDHSVVGELTVPVDSTLRDRDDVVDGADRAAGHDGRPRGVHGGGSAAAALTGSRGLGAVDPSLVDFITCLKTTGVPPCAHTGPRQAQELYTVTQASSEQNTIWLTQDAFDKLQAELENLRGPVRSEIVARISAARDEGDLKENGGYHAAREEQGKAEARIRQLEDMLRRAEVGETPADDGVVEPGMTVTYRFAGDDDVETFLLGAREMADTTELTVYSPQSPLGSAIIGHKKGETVPYKAPNGTTLEVEIVDAVPYTG